MKKAGVQMDRYEKVLEALTKPENEPINWLFGSVLREQASQPRSHFLLEALEKSQYPHLASWNYWIRDYRSTLINPAVAQQKAVIDLRAGETDAENKLRSFLAEVFAVLHLKKAGYRNFEVILPPPDRTARKKTPDYLAEFEGKKARIEVKNLREPDDLVRNVAKQRWKERQDAEPERYNFRAVLRLSERGRISEVAIARLHNIIDHFPERKEGRVEEVLDGGVKIVIERADKRVVSATGLQGLILTQMFEGGDKPGQLVIQSTIKEEDLEFDLPEFQGFLIKVLRVVAEATPKFFGSAGGEDTKNVLFLNWEPPDILVSAQLPAYTQEKIKELFADFDLDLDLVISFKAPELPVSVLRSASAGR
jgi:hypothetical protein